MSICQSFRLINLELKFESLYEIRKRSADLAGSAIVTGHVIIGGGLEGKWIPGDEFGFPEVVDGEVELLHVQFGHGSQVQILTQFLWGFVKLGVVDAEYTFLDADYFLHDVNALRIFALL